MARSGGENPEQTAGDVGQSDASPLRSGHSAQQMLTIEQLPFGEETLRHIPCLIANFLGYPWTEEAWHTGKALHRWAYNDFD